MRLPRLYEIPYIVNFRFQSLVPHSDHGDHDEEAEKDDQQALFRASIVFLGIYLFFLVECTMKLKLARRKKTDKRVSICLVLFKNDIKLGIIMSF